MPADDVVLYAQWTEILFTVVYNLNGGAGTVPPVSAVAGAIFFAASADDIIAPTGMQFKEWNTAYDGSGASYAPGAAITMPDSDLVLYAIWEYLTYPVTLTDGVGYVLAPAGSSSPVVYGGSFTFSFALDAEYSDSPFTVYVNGVSVSLIDGQYTIADITEAKTVTVTELVLNTYAVTLTSGVGYVLAPVESSSPVVYGGSFTFIFVLDVGYSDSPFTVYVNGISVDIVDGQYTITDITEAKVVTVSALVQNTYDVLLTPGTGYTLTALSSSPVVYGGAFTFSFALDVEYSDSPFAVYVNGAAVAIADGGQYTITDITEAKAVSVSALVQNTYDVLLTPGTGYTLTALSSSPVVYGGAFTFSFALDVEYSASPFAVYVNGAAVAIADGGQYTITNITEDQTVTVTELVLNTYAVTLTSGIGYVLAPVESSSPVVYGGAFTFIFVLDVEYSDSPFAVYVNGEPVSLIGGQYTITDITEAKAVSVSALVLNTYAVTYDLNYGSGTVPVESDKVAGDMFEVASADGLTAPIGMMFKEWNTQADGLGTAYAAGDTVTVPSGGITLYAIWEDIPVVFYTVTYALNGGTGTVPTQADLTEGAAFVVASADGLTAPAGMLFKEWNSESDGSGTAYAEGAVIFMPASDLTLYAIWEDIPVVTYAVTYDANGGTGTVPEAGLYAPGDIVTVADAALSKDGWLFLGWSLDSDGSAGVLAAGDEFAMPADDVVLYAVWEEIIVVTYAVTYNLNGGTGTVPTQADLMEGAAFLAASADGLTAPEGTWFYEWNTESDGTGTSYAAGAAVIMPASDLTLYAIWEYELPIIISYSVSASTMDLKDSNIVTITITGNYYVDDVLKEMILVSMDVELTENGRQTIELGGFLVTVVKGNVKITQIYLGNPGDGNNGNGNN